MDHDFFHDAPGCIVCALQGRRGVPTTGWARTLESLVIPEGTAWLWRPVCEQHYQMAAEKGLPHRRVPGTITMFRE